MKKILLICMLTLCLVLVSCKDNEEKIKNNAENKEEVQTEQRGEEQETKKEPVATLITLYFADEQALYLHKEQRVVGVTEDMQIEMVVLDQLFSGPMLSTLSPALEGEDLVNSVIVDDSGLCTVDFKSDFVLLNTGGTARESFVIGSIVNSLCELENIEKVKINIDGNIAAEFGHSTLDTVFLPQTDLVK